MLESKITLTPYRQYTNGLAEKYPLLTREQEREVIRDSQSKNGKSQTAREKAFYSNIKLVASRARKLAEKIGSKYGYSKQKIEELTEDFCSEGIIGFDKGLRKFDLGRKNKLSTYITWWIDQTIRRSDPYQKETKKRINVQYLRPDDENREPGTFSENFLKDHKTKSPLRTTITNDEKEMIEKALTRLNKREEQVIRLRYGLIESPVRKAINKGLKKCVKSGKIKKDKKEFNPPYKYDEIGILIGRTHMRAKQLEKIALKKLRFCFPKSESLKI